MIEVDSTRSFSINGGALAVDEKRNYLVVRHGMDIITNQMAI